MGHDNENTSIENSKKLDRLLEGQKRVEILLHGEADRPGVVAELREVRAVVFGDEADIGDHHRTTVMWRIHVWVLCSASAALGGILTLATKWIVTHFHI